MRRYSLWLLLVACFVFRLGLSLAYPSLSCGDEMFEAMEPAHHLVFGYGVMAWEWHDGVRSWAYPGFLAGIMWLAAKISDSPWAYLSAIYGVMICFSLIPVVVTYRLVLRFAEPKLALMAALIPAFWYECIYWSARTINGALPAYLLILAAYLAFVAREDCPQRAARWLGSGALLGIVTMLRFHLSPEVLLLAVYCCRRSAKAWLYMSLGFLVTFMPLGMLDWVTWEYPFQSIIRNFDYNIIQGMASSQFGVRPFYFYVMKLVTHQLIYFIPFLYFAYRGALKNKLLAGLLLANFISFTFISHKEYRFIVLSIIVMMMLVGMGLAHFMQPPQRSRRRWWVIVVFSVLLWAFGSWYYFVRKQPDNVNVRINLMLSRVIAQQYHGRISAILFQRQINKHANAYAFLHHDIPIDGGFDISDGGVHLPKRRYPVLLVLKSGTQMKVPLKKLFCVQSHCVYQYPA